MHRNRLTWPLRALVTGWAVSSYGDWLTTIALLVALYGVTGSAVVPAFYMVARTGPRLLGPLLGGHLADQGSPVRVLLGAQILQALGVIATLAALRTGSIGLTLTAVASCQLIGSMARPCVGPIVARLADPTQSASVNSTLTFWGASAIIVAPVLGAPILVWGGATPLLAVDAASFVVSAVLLATLLGSAADGEVPRARADPWEGVRLVWRTPALRAVAGAHLSGAATVTVVQAVLVVAATEQFGGAALTGPLYAAVGVGGSLGAFATSRWRPNVSSGTVIAATGLAEVLALAGVAVAPTALAAGACLLVSACAGSVYPSLGAIWLQTTLPHDVLGRASAAITFALSVGLAAGALLATALVPVLGWRSALGLTAAGAGIVDVVLVLRPGTRPSTATRTDPDRAAGTETGEPARLEAGHGESTTR